MDKDTETTVVVFRKWGKRNGGGIIALFPLDTDSTYFCNSYEHVGQHAMANYVGVVSQSTPATPTEYASLKSELEALGYKLDVRKRAPSWRTR